MGFIEATDWVTYLEVGRTLQGFDDTEVGGVVAEEEVEAVLAVTQPGGHLRCVNFDSSAIGHNVSGPLVRKGDGLMICSFLGLNMD